MLNRGEQTLTAVTGSGGRLHFGMVAGIKSERWPTSNRNPRPDCVGIRKKTDTELVFSYLMDMRDAENSLLLQKMADLRKSEHPVNWNDLKTHFDQGSFGRVPDLRPYTFRRPIRVES